MKRLIRIIAKRLGVKTRYLVTATAPKGSGWITGTANITARPWIHEENTQELVDHFEEIGLPPNSNIIMIHKLGI